MMTLSTQRDSAIQFSFIFREEAPMSRDLADNLVRVLPENGNAHEELAALGVVVAGVMLCVESVEARSDLVEAFCETLRKSVRIDFN
jgi:hypothetical protein